MTKQAVATKEEIPSVEALSDTPLEWEPRILAFACHYCAFAAADLAGVMRLSYSPNVKVVRLPCTGKLDVLMVLRANGRILTHGSRRTES